MHVHYLDVWEYIASQIAANMRIPFSLIVTTTQDAELIVPPETDYLERFKVEAVENRGRDILPFLKALDAAEPFDIGLKLHTKKSPHRSDGEAWGRAMVDSLLGKPETVDDVLQAMQANPHVGIITAEGMTLRLGYRVGTNQPLMRDILDALSIALPAGAIREGWIAAGSMFWFRPQAVSGLLTPVTQRMFTAEQGKLDGTAAHALERLFVLIAGQRGYTSFPVNLLEELSGVADQARIDRMLNETQVGESVFVIEPVRPAAFIAKWFPGVMGLYAKLPEPVRKVVARCLKAR